MNSSVAIMAWPGPGYFPLSPALALRLDRRLQPQEMYRALLAQLRHDHQAGVHQVLLPPAPLPTQISDDDPEWRELLWRSMDIDTQCWASFWPGSDTQSGDAALVVANRWGEAAGQWAAYRQGLFQQLFAKVPDFRVHGPLPAAPQLSDSGELNHVRIQVGERTAHLFSYDDSLLLPEQMRSKQAKRQTRGAHLAAMQAVGVQPGQSIIARQHWRAADWGLYGLRDACWALGDTLVLYESACGDQHEIVTTLDRLVPGIRLHVVRDGECRLRDMRKQYGLGAELIALANGQRLLRYDPRWDDRRAKRLRDQLAAEGFFDIAAAGIAHDVIGLRHNGLWALRMDLSAAQWAGMHAPWKISDELLTKLERWVEGAAWPELRIEDFADPDKVSQLAAAQQELLQLLSAPAGQTSTVEG
jgi:succinylarginine dihydrolase